MSSELTLIDDSEKLRHSYEKNAKIINDKIEQELKNKVVISLYGSVNAGKSTLINALLGKKLSEVSPIPGFTTDIKLFQYGKDVVIADTPGIEDIDEATAAKAKEFVESDADLILFFISSDSGLTSPILKSFKSIVELKKEVLGLLTKIDIKDADEVEVLVKHTTEKLSALRKGVKLVPVSGKKNINIDILQKEILSILDEKGKDILYAKANKDKWPAIHHYILNACGEITGMGVLTGVVDLDKVTSIQLELVKKIACVHNVSVNEADLIHFLTDLCSRDVSFKVFTEVHKILAPFINKIPFIEKGINIALPSAATYGIGYAANTYYSSGMKQKADEIDKIFREKVMEYGKKDVEELKMWIKGKVLGIFGN